MWKVARLAAHNIPSWHISLPSFLQIVLPCRQRLDKKRKRVYQGLVLSKQHGCVLREVWTLPRWSWSYPWKNSVLLGVLHPQKVRRFKLLTHLYSLSNSCLFVSGYHQNQNSLKPGTPGLEVTLSELKELLMRWNQKPEWLQSNLDMKWWRKFVSLEQTQLGKRNHDMLTRLYFNEFDVSGTWIL